MLSTVSTEVGLLIILSIAVYKYGFGISFGEYHFLSKK